MTYIIHDRTFKRGTAETTCVSFIRLRWRLGRQTFADNAVATTRFDLIV